MAKQLTLDAACDNVKDGFRVEFSKSRGSCCTDRSVETYECYMIRKWKKLQTYCCVVVCGQRHLFQNEKSKKNWTSSSFEFFETFDSKLRLWELNWVNYWLLTKRARAKHWKILSFYEALFPYYFHFTLFFWWFSYSLGGIYLKRSKILVVIFPPMFEISQLTLFILTCYVFLTFCEWREFCRNQTSNQERNSWTSR